MGCLVGRSVGRSVCSRAVPFWGVPCLLLPPRSVRGAGVQRGGLSGHRKKGVSWCGARKGTAAPEGVGRDCRSDLGVCRCVCVCVRQRAGAAKGWAGAGRRAGRGPGRAGCARGVPSEGGRCEGADRKVGKRGLTLSLSLSGLSSAPSPAGGAPCTSPRERSVGLLSSVRPPLGLILFHHPRLSPLGAAQTPRHLQRH